MEVREDSHFMCFKCGVQYVVAEGEEDSKADSTLTNHHDHQGQHLPANQVRCGSANEHESTDECSLSGSSVKVCLT